MDELIKSLPPEALFGLGAMIGIGLLVRYMGLLQGRQTDPAESVSKAQVAAVIVDPSALKAAAAAIEAQTMEAINFRKSLERAAEALCRSMDRLCVEVDDLKKEMIRKGH